MSALGVAVFDFDRTLVQQESMGIFLKAIAGRYAFYAACGVAAVAVAMALPRRNVRNLFRSTLLRRVLAGRTMAEALTAAEKIFHRLTWNTAIEQALYEHQQARRHVVIATGSLSVYMPHVLKLRGIEGVTLLATEMVVLGGVITGEMATPSCTWEEKARRVQPLLRLSEGESWGYGNLPPDGPMLALTRYPQVVPT